MVDIILINPPIKLSQWELKLGSKLPPLGLASLAGYVRDKGISVKILDASNLGLDIDSVLDFIKIESPAYVGITATTNMITFAAQLADEIKKQFPHIITIIGGPHISALPEETIERFPSFDIGVYGEGEKTLFEIINRGKIDNTIHGIVFRDNGIVIKNPPREYIENLDDLPFPAYDLLPNFPDFYRPTPNNYSCLPVAPVISSRGCPYSCTFCTQGVFGHRLRAFSIDYLISLIKYLQDKFKIKEICFYDDIFLLNKKKLYEFIEKIEKNKLDLVWSCEGRVDQFEEQMLIDMKKAGCWQISFGVESGSQKVLDYFNKKISVEQISKTIISVQKAKMRSRAYLIIGSPPETLQTLEETKKLILNAPFSDIHISFFTLMPGSAAYQSLIGTTHFEDYKKINQYLIYYIPPNLSHEILTDFMNDLYKSFYLHPKRLFRYLFMLFNRHKTIHLLMSGVGFIKLTFSREKTKVL
ncbi:MAG: radical SAM protein [Candidatus Methanoperedens sp.]